MRGRGRAGVALAVALLLAAPAGAKVLLAKDEALALAFADPDRVEARVFVLTEAQAAAVERAAGSALESRLWTIHVGWRDARILGYAIIDSHVVRTLPEACMIVLDAAGVVQRVEILAFYEPAEYQPAARWLAQFEGRTLRPDLRVRRDIHGITGATLSANAMTASVRRALALHRVLIGAGTAGTGPTEAVD